MNFLRIVEAKRDGRRHPTAEIQDLVAGVVEGSLPDYQAAAWLMAVYFRGLDDAECRDLTLAMRDSGEVLRFPGDPRPVVDKHSTGGVGDKVSLPLAPLLACLGFRVPMISGRGLGITGGTLDKLASIPGFRTALTRDEILDQVDRLGVAMAAQTDRMVPADRRLYALRDVTATVPHPALITASILSKKLAEGLGALVLDVKVGSAAFLPRPEDARALARAMTRLATACGVRTRAVLTDMDTPVGRSAGNWLEVGESIECLRGRGPADLRSLVVELAAHLVVLSGHPPASPDPAGAPGTADIDSARSAAAAWLDSGRVLDRWHRMLAAQGADLDATARQLDAGPIAPVVVELTADRDGWVQRCDARVCGEVVRDLGGGRLRQDDVIDPRVGLDRLARPGDPVRRGELLARIHAATPAAADIARTRLAQAIPVGDSPPDSTPLVLEVVDAEG